MKGLRKIMMIAYLVLSVICTIALAITLFVECNPYSQLTLLLQAVVFAFVSGMLWN